MFIFGELHPLSRRRQRAVVEIQHRPAAGEQPGRGAEVVGSAQGRLDLGGEDLEIKGLGQQVVAPHLHGGDHAHVVRGGGDEDDGHLGDFADLRAPVVAVEKGQGDVQQHQLGVKGGKLREHAVKPLRPGHLIAPALQMPLHGPGNDGVVLHDENAIHGASPPDSKTRLEHTTARGKSQRGGL